MRFMRNMWSFEAGTALKVAQLKMIKVGVKENFCCRYTVITVHKTYN